MSELYIQSQTKSHLEIICNANNIPTFNKSKPQLITSLLEQLTIKSSGTNNTSAVNNNNTNNIDSETENEVTSVDSNMDNDNASSNDTDSSDDSSDNSGGNNIEEEI